jgi:MoaA/NifB/PqqE/SkfB family radical SAM enzyme
MGDVKAAIAELLQVNPRAYANAILNLGEYWLGRARPISRPPLVDIVLTKACNLKCVFCISYGSLTGERWMDFDLYRRIARTLFPTTYGLFICSGGEPLLYPHIRDALALARDYRTLVTMTSNGMLLDRETAEWMTHDQSLHELCISFDGARAQTLERIRRGAKYEQILANLEYLSFLKGKNRSLFPRMWFRFVLMRSNAEELPELFEICAKYGLYQVEVVYLCVSNDIDFSESLFNYPELVADVFTEARRRAKEHGITLRLPAVVGQDTPKGKCREPWSFCQIDSDGSLRFCHRAWRQRLGFFDENFNTIWHHPAYQRIRRTVTSETPYFPHCSYCIQRWGCNDESAHHQQLLSDTYVINGLEDWQVPFNQRQDENVSSWRERKREPDGADSAHGDDSVEAGGRHAG